MRIRLALLLAFAIGCGSSEEVFIGELTAPVVYGADDRVEVFGHPDLDLRRIAQESIVALIPSFRIDREDGTYALFSQTLQDLQRLCPDELFGNQPTAASCSGVLIDDDLVVTAGHCIDASARCESYAYVFNYHLDGPDRLATIRDEDVYSCARVVALSRPEFDSHTPDFAVVQLDRPVEGAHAPVSIRPAIPLAEQEPVAMIGFGSGLPAKIDSGGEVHDPRAEQLDFFIANVDAFQGHSGSATFDSKNRLAGILIGGRTPDYVTLDDETCRRVSVYPDSAAAEVVHNVAPIVASLCAEGWEAEEICGPGVVPSNSSACSASTGSAGFLSGCLGLLLFVAARRLRRPAA